MAIIVTTVTWEHSGWLLAFLKPDSVEKYIFYLVDLKNEKIINNFCKSNFYISTEVSQGARVLFLKLENSLKL